MDRDNSCKFKIVLAGSVGSSRRTLQGLLRHRANVVGVLGLASGAAKNVSGYSRLDDLISGLDIPYVEFSKINQPDIVETVRTWKPDLLFVVGLSQLVKPELLAIPRIGTVGFHPTWLPEGRGRAPVSWLILDDRPGAATFFLMDEGMDSGAILSQEPFYVSDGDYASDAIEKLESAIDRALDRWLPQLIAGQWNPAPQSQKNVTYNGRRSPEDGLIDWSLPAKTIYNLVRATSRPHPGAYTYVKNYKLIVWRAELETKMPFRGVVGRILDIDNERGCLVQTGNGLLWLTELEFVSENTQDTHPKLRVGMKLGYIPQDEVFAMKQRLTKLEELFAGF
jgi:methionyl-tRNA formyltransferase